MAPVIRLDTHVVVWLYTGETERLSRDAIESIESSSPVVSPIVQLELTFLNDIGRLSVTGADIIGDLRDRIGLELSDASMASVVRAAEPLGWTRDPFDRMIVADALVAAAHLMTKDHLILQNVGIARW